MYTIPQSKSEPLSEDENSSDEDAATTTVVVKEEPNEQRYAQANLNSFWPSIMNKMKQIQSVDAKQQQLPLARIKKIMKLDDDVKMISAEAPLLFAKASEIFIHELTLMAWVFTEENKRRTLQRSDVAMAISTYDQFDFLIDIVPRDEIKPSQQSQSSPASDSLGATAFSNAAASGPSTSASADSTAGGGAADGSTKNGHLMRDGGLIIAGENKMNPTAQIQYYVQVANNHRQAAVLEAASVRGDSNSLARTTVGATSLSTGSELSVASTVSACGMTSPLNTIAKAIVVPEMPQLQQGLPGSGGGSSGLTTTTPTMTTLPITTASANSQPQHAILAGPQHHQMITLSNGQNIILAAPQMQQHAQQGQLLSSIQQQQQAQPFALNQIQAQHPLIIGGSPQQQYHIVQQVLTRNGEVQHIQVREPRLSDC